MANRPLITGILAVLLSIFLTVAQPIAADTNQNPEFSVTATFQKSASYCAQIISQAGKALLEATGLSARDAKVSPNHNSIFYEPTQADIDRINGFLSERDPDNRTDEPTVVFNRFVGANRDVVLVKDAKSRWFSFALGVSHTTPQGDPRLAFAVLGASLALKLGYDIRQVGGKVYITAPSAESFRIRIEKINQILKNRSQDPIAYLPIESGYLSESEIFNLALAATGDYLFFFPYADKNKKLAPHEVGFHLFLSYSKKILARIQAINQRYQDLILFLESSNRHAGVEKLEKIHSFTTAIKTMRAEQLDIGTGNYSYNIGITRKKALGLSYTEMMNDINHRDSLSGTYNLNLLVQAGHNLTDVWVNNIRDHIGSYHTRVFEDQLRAFQNLHEEQDKLDPNASKSVQDWGDEFILGLDERHRQIEDAIDEIIRSENKAGGQKSEPTL